MRKRVLTVTAWAMMSFAALAHEGETHQRAAPAEKEQMDWGIVGDAKAARRTIRMTMADDMRFTPDRIEVKLGETVRIVVKNAGRMQHEFVLGTRKELEEHAALMRKFPGMVHDEPYMAHVAPGKSVALVWAFNRAGDFDFACLVPGHYEAGMKGAITVKGKS